MFKSGLIQAVIAYSVWGLFPLYWYFLKHLPAMEILANRIIWSLIFLLFLLTLYTRWQQVLAALKKPKVLAVLLLTTVILCLNWLLYIWAVIHGYVIEASLGYYINPLVSMALGAVFLSERLRKYQYVAVLLATVGVLILTFAYGRTPWVALTLAVSFGVYGLLRKIVDVESKVALFIETALVFFPAVLYLAFLGKENTIVFGSFSEQLLLMGGGVITAIPLICLANALKVMPLSTIGFIQYIGPTLQFLCGLLVFKEPFGSLQLLSFICIWLGLVVYTGETIWQRRRKIA